MVNSIRSLLVQANGARKTTSTNDFENNQTLSDSVGGLDERGKRNKNKKPAPEPTVPPTTVTDPPTTVPAVTDDAAYDYGNYDDYAYDYDGEFNPLAFGSGKWGKENDEHKRLREQPDFVGFCWNCNLSGNFTNSNNLRKRCIGEGHMSACFDGSNGCYSTMRKRGGHVIQLEMGCKGHDACMAESNSNFKWQKGGRRCKPQANDEHSHSECHSCCEPTDKNCNLRFMMKSKPKWNPNYKSYNKQN